MALIKSALELAMERTKDLKVDKEAIANNEAKLLGKKIAGLFLNKPEETDVSKEIAKLEKKQQKKAKEGAFEVFANRIQLPTSENAISCDNLAPLEDGIKALCSVPFGEKKISTIFEQLEAFFKQYVDSAKQIDEAIRKQFAPRLQQKEQELSQRMGRHVKLDPMQDPDFAAFYKQNVTQMKAQYENALKHAKSELASLCAVEEN